MLFWFWIAYAICAVIAYVLVVRSFLRSAAVAKRTMLEKAASGYDTHYYRDRYDGELRGLVLVPPLAAAVWPFLLLAFALERLVTACSKALDKAVTATMKESDQ